MVQQKGDESQRDAPLKSLTCYACVCCGFPCGRTHAATMRSGVNINVDATLRNNARGTFALGGGGVVDLLVRRGWQTLRRRRFARVCVPKDRFARTHTHMVGICRRRFFFCDVVGHRMASGPVQQADDVVGNRYTDIGRHDLIFADLFP